MNQSGCPKTPCDDPIGDRWCITIDPVACAEVDGEDDFIFCDDSFPVSNICHARTNRKKVECGKNFSFSAGSGWYTSILFILSKRLGFFSNFNNLGPSLFLSHPKLLG